MKGSDRSHQTRILLKYYPRPINISIDLAGGCFILPETLSRCVSSYEYMNTACSFVLLDRAKELQVVQGNKSLNHNAVTFSMSIGRRPGPGASYGTQIYNTPKVRWSEFLTALDIAKEEQAFTVEMVESADLCEQFDGVVGLYTKCIQHTYDATILQKCLTQRINLHWWSPNFYNGCPDDELETILLSQDREIYGVVRDIRKNRADVLLKDNSGRTCSPNEPEIFLANTFFPADQMDTDSPYYTELRRQLTRRARIRPSTITSCVRFERMNGRTPEATSDESEIDLMDEVIGRRTRNNSRGRRRGRAPAASAFRRTRNSCTQSDKICVHA
ncbi:hypothetical protein EVAR_89885_1 [Eumeta japonica]|uniref:Uncharacterized protein n=1 Tax=Eumeta variegata TaxID=151549 RepID=A0A4C1YY32_EUMVA|nr:hypothetical protein EVAR_89885_1 [Eumeta japonica]